MCKDEVWAFFFQRTAGATGKGLGLGLEFPSGLVSHEVLAVFDTSLSEHACSLLAPLFFLNQRELKSEDFPSSAGAFTCSSL